MATRTSVGSGPWSASATWDTGIPADGDTVVIAAGHAVVFDVDTSAWVTGIAGITITGNLKISTTISSAMKMKASTTINGAGIFNIGENETPIPYTTKFLLTGSSGWYINGASGLKVTVYAAEPVSKIIRLTAIANPNPGDITLSVDTDVSGDLWADGDTVYVVRNLKGSKQVEKKSIAAGGITPTTITISGGVFGTYPVGSWVVLLTRNVYINAASVSTLFSNCTNVEIGGGAFYGGTRLIQGGGTGTIISGGIIGECQYLLYVTSISTITGCVLANISGVFQGSTGMEVSSCVFAGCVSVLSYDYDQFIRFDNCLVLGCTGFGGGRGNLARDLTVIGGNYMFGGLGLTIYDSNVTGVSYVFHNAMNLLAWNITGSGADGFTYQSDGEIWNTIPWGGEAVSACLYNAFSQLIYGNHSGVEGAYKAYCYGGVSVASQTTVIPPGYSLAYIHTLSGSYYSFMRRRVIVPAGESVSVEVCLRKTTSMAYLPKVYLMANIENPLCGEAPIDTFEMTDSINTWESATYTINNSEGSTDKEYALWFVGKNPSGNVYSAFDITTAGTGGGGSVKILPGSGRLGL